MSGSAVASSEFTDIACILLPEMTVLYAQVSPQGDTCLQVCALYKIGLKTSIIITTVAIVLDTTSGFCDMERKDKT